MIHTKLNFFQLNNLIRNHVSFLFYNLSTSIVDWFDVLSKIHVRNLEIISSAEEVLPDIENRKLPKDFSIIILCEDGVISEQLIKQLEEQGYTNIFSVDGGRKQMDQERLEG